MRTGPGAAARDARHGPRRRWIRRLLLAVSLVVVVLSIVGMHQLSLGHDVATGPSTSSTRPQLNHVGSGDMLPMAEHLGDHSDTGVFGGGTEDACPDCADHQMAFGSCLLALTLLVLTWLLTPPRPSHVLPFLLSRLAPPLAVPDVGRLIPSLSLVELSVRRT